jgi:hypothetical protein
MFMPTLCVMQVWGMTLELAKGERKLLCYKFSPFVATPLWDKCEDETHTPKSGKLESLGTPENSELDCKGQNTLH